MLSPDPKEAALAALTPTSRVKALIAHIDRDTSDEDSPVQRPTKAVSRRPLTSVSGNQRSKDDQNDRLAIEDNSELSDSEPLPYVPRGKLAARLHATQAKKDDSAETDDQHSDENAYQRVKKQLSGARPNIRARNRGDAVARESPSGDEAVQNLPLSPRIHQAASNHVETPQRARSQKPPSPGLFVTPPTISQSQDADEVEHRSDEEDPDLPQQPQKNAKFLELVAKTKAKIEAREAEKKRKVREKTARRREIESTLFDDGSAGSDMSEEDRIAEQRLTQASRPTRKASKKALEEMNRETQRMNRNMQLTHQARTKRRISKDSLLARFNFQTSKSLPLIPEPQTSSSVANSRQASDVEDTPANVSPPTSPPQIDDLKEASTNRRDQLPVSCVPDSTGDADDVLPTIDDLMSMSHPQKTEEKGGRQLNTTGKSLNNGTARSLTLPLEFRLPKLPSNDGLVDLDSESEKELASTKQRARHPKGLSRLDAYSRKKIGSAKESRSLMTLQALAHLHSPEGPSRYRKESMNASDMQVSLQKRARQQALDERNAKIEELKARGVFISTTEEREKDQIHVEDMLEKARREAEEIKQKEKRAKRKERVANGDEEGSENSSDDEDYEGEKGEDNGSELSNSDDSEEDSEAGDSDGDVKGANEENEEPDDARQKAERDPMAMLDDEASESEEDETDDEEAHDGDEDTDGEQEHPIGLRARRTKQVVLDDEDDEQANDAQKESHQLITPAKEAPKTNEEMGPNVAPFFEGFQSRNDSFGLTQAFAATMANTQASDEDQETVNSAGFHSAPPQPDLPILDLQNMCEMIPDSQDRHNQNGSIVPEDTNESGRIELHYSPTLIRQESIGESQLLSNTTQLSQIPDPTQDAGFLPSSPAPERFKELPPSTVDTVLLPAMQQADSPKRKGRLRRRGAIPSDSGSEDDVSKEGAEMPQTNAFAVMKEKRKEAAAQVAFNKKKSEAKEMVEEQAQESEDEYAGLGGASDDDSGGEEDEDVRKMMDHGEVNVDERALAALHADAERVNDEKAIEKLYRDINNGGLRRKRGAELDLTDSEDDADARRRRKQREFARMRKALLADEKVGKIAEDPKKIAFLRAIEDREPDDDIDLDFLDRPAAENAIAAASIVENSTQDDSQSQSQQLGGSNNAPAEDATRNQKQPLQETNPNMRPPSFARRTAAVGKKPSTLAEIRQSVSFLVENPGADQLEAPEPSSSASEDESADPGLHSLTRQHPRRTQAGTATAAIIDRLSLKRAASSASSATTSISTTTTTSRLAFYAPAANNTTTDNTSGGGGGGGAVIADGFRVPSLLRRATTQLTALGASSTTTGVTYAAGTTSAAAAAGAGAGGGGSGVKTGGSRKSSVNYFAREGERRRVRDGVEKRRREERERTAREGAKAGRLRGLFVAGGNGGWGV